MGVPRTRPGRRTVAGLLTTVAGIGLAGLVAAPAEAAPPPAAAQAARTAPPAPDRPVTTRRTASATTCSVLGSQIQHGPGASFYTFGVACRTTSLVTAVVANYDANGAMLNYGDMPRTVPAGSPWYQQAALTLAPRAYWSCGGLWDDSTGVNLTWQCAS